MSLFPENLKLRKLKLEKGRNASSAMVVIRLGRFLAHRGG
jgi:hypothetical protein